MKGFSPALFCSLFLSVFQEGVNTDPVGPSGWGLRSWIGFFLYIFIFVGAVALIFWIAKGAEGEDREDGGSE